jgi:hypothetical protein
MSEELETMCFDTYDDYIAVESIPTHPYFILKNKIKELRQKIIDSTIERDPNVNVRDLEDIIDCYIIPMSEIKFDDPNYVPPFHFQDPSKELFVFDRDFGLIEMNLDLKGCRNWEIGDVYSKLFKLFMRSSIDNEVLTIIVENRQDYAKIAKIIEHSNTKKHISHTFYSGDSILKSSKIYHDTDVRDEIIKNMIRIHDIQYDIDEDNWECPPHPPEYDWEYDAFPISPKLRLLYKNN